MRILLGFMGNSINRMRYTYGEGLHPTRFPMCAVFEKYEREDKAIDHVLVLGTEGTFSNRNEVMMNMFAIRENRFDLLDCVDQYIEEHKILEDIHDIINHEYIDSLIDNMKVEELSSQQQLNDTFSKIDSLLEKYIKQYDNIELVLDVTNGYRTQPLLGLLVTNFIKRKYPLVAIENIWYGVLDEKNGNSLLSIQKYNEFIDWAMGLQNYLDTGNASILLNLVYDSNDDKAKNLVKKLDEFSRRLKVGRNDEAKNCVQEVLDAINEFKTNPHSDEGLVLNSMLEKIEQKFYSFKEGFYFALIEWNYIHGDIQQALTVCNEFFPYVGYCHQMICNNTFDGKYTDKDLNDYKEYQKLFPNKDIIYRKIIPYEDKIKIIYPMRIIYSTINECINNLYNQNTFIDYCQMILKCVLENHNPWKDIRDSLLAQYQNMYIRYKRNSVFYTVPINEELLTLVFRDLAYQKMDENEEIKHIINDLREECFKQTGRKENFRLQDISYNKRNIEKAKTAYLWLFENKADIADFLLNGPCLLDRIIKVKSKEKEEKHYYLNDMLEAYKKEDDLFELMPSTYFIEHIDEVNDIINTFSVIKNYRNDINHGGFEFTKRLNNWDDQTHKLEDFYQINKDEDNLKRCLDKIIIYMKKLENRSR